jgi:hypothetical protein
VEATSKTQARNRPVITTGSAASNDPYFDAELESRLTTYQVARKESLVDLDNLKTNVLETSDYHSPGSVYSLQVVEVDGKLKDNFFANAYQKDAWVFVNNYRHQTPNARYYATDVVIMQYRLLSQNEGFFGRLPKTMERHNIVNEETLAFLNRSEGMAEVSRTQGFLSSTDNGKSTARILEAFGMEAYGLTVERTDGSDGPAGVNAIVKVRRNTNSARQKKAA